MSMGCEFIKREGEERRSVVVDCCACGLRFVVN